MTEDEIFENQMKQLDQSQALVKPNIVEENPLEQEIKKTKDVLEKLLFLGKPHTKDVSIAGLTFTLKILQTRDLKSISKKFKSLPSLDLENNGEVLVLASSIQAINGISVETLYGKEGDPTSQLLTSLLSFPNHIVSELRDQYEAFSAEVSKKIVDKDFLVK